jgi:pimeloyl-ACP methyl ester carboxylesterase
MIRGPAANDSPWRALSPDTDTLSPNTDTDCLANQLPLSDTSGQMRTQSIEADGARLVAQVSDGGNPATQPVATRHPVVLLHGFGDDRHSWDPLTGELSRARRVISYDLRGFGESTEYGQVKFRHSRDFLIVLNTLGIAQCDLVGVSMGGAVALNCALDYPERLRRLILISPALVGWHWSEAWRSLWGRIREAAAAGNMEQARELWWNHPLFATTRAHQAASDILRESIFRYSGKQWLRDNEERALPDLDRLYQLSVPTLLITGQQDVEDFRLMAGLIEGAAPGVTRIDMTGAGHLPQLEYPAQVLEHINAFLCQGQ